MAIAYVGNDGLIRLDELTNAVTESYVNSATVTATLKDANGDNVSGQSWPLSLSYVAASNGRYQGTLEDDAVITGGVKYVLHVDVDAGSDLIAHWEVDVIAQVRTA